MVEIIVVVEAIIAGIIGWVDIDELDIPIDSRDISEAME